VMVRAAICAQVNTTLEANKHQNLLIVYLLTRTSEPMPEVNRPEKDIMERMLTCRTCLFAMKESGVSGSTDSHKDCATPPMLLIVIRPMPHMMPSRANKSQNSR